MLKKVHHINFVVRDLDTAIDRYQLLFNARFGHRESLSDRGAEAARFRLGNVWIVLVQPTRPDSILGRYLEDHGEGFLLISYQVDDVIKSAKCIEEHGVNLLNSTPRHGLDDWRVIDLDPQATFGVPVQIIESGDD
ncbi:MAG: VOC family protein [Woeseia sp.]